MPANSLLRSIIVGLFFMLSILASAQNERYVTGEMLIQLPYGVNAEDWIARHPELPVVEIGKKVSNPLNIYLLKFDSSSVNEYDFLNLLRTMYDVENAQFNHYTELRATAPNDPLYSSQWQYNNTGQSGGTPGADLDMELAWDITTGGLTAFGDTIVVCVIDDGIYAQHPDIAPNLWVNHDEIPNNGIDDDNNGFVDDYRGWDTYTSSDAVYESAFHGTPVAGIIGAKGNNGIGVAGVNWNVKLMIVEGGSGVESEVLEAYSYPLAMRKKYNQSNGLEGAFVVATNSSWGINFGQPSNAPLWCAMYDSMGTYGILSAGATANNGVDIDVVGDLPTACPSDYLISVTNMNHNDVKVSAAAWGLTHVDLGAFGEGTYTTNGGSNTYGPFGGTSGATPHVAGAVALLYSAQCPSLINLAKTNPDSAALLVKQFIMDGTELNASLTGITVSEGRMNVNNSMNLLLQYCNTPCLPPSLFPISAITDTSAFISWLPNDSSVLSNQLEWRMIGDTTWNVVLTTDSSYWLYGLQPCTEYEYRMISFCQTDTSTFFSSSSFKTDGCCENPSNFKVDSVFEFSASANWGSVSAAQSYQVRIREVGGNWTQFSTVDTFFNFSSLQSCTGYEIEISIICANDTLDFEYTQSFQTLGCVSCANINYCPPLPLNASEEWIEFVALNNETNVSGSNSGYGNFTTSLWVNPIFIGQSNTLSMQPGYASSTYDEYFRVWIDYNQDGDFDDPGELVFDPGTTVTSVVSDSFVVPGNAIIGSTRMRVSMYWNDPPGPCDVGINTFGEIEDYCVSVQNLASCLPPSLSPITGITDTSAFISWMPSDTSVLTNQLEWRIVGDSIWNVILTTDSSYLAFGFTTLYRL
jgi:serine protease